MTLEFQNTLHRSATEMCAAIASAWLSANGANDIETQVEALRTTSDEALAAEAIEGWGLDQPESEDSTLTWMEAREIDESDLASAFADLRGDLMQDATGFGPGDLSTLFETLYCLTPEQAAAEQAAKDARDAAVLASILPAYTVTASNDAFWQSLVVKAANASDAAALFRAYLTEIGSEEGCGDYTFSDGDVAPFEPTSRWLGEPSAEVQMMDSGGNG